MSNNNRSNEPEDTATDNRGETTKCEQVVTEEERPTTGEKLPVGQNTPALSKVDSKIMLLKESLANGPHARKAQERREKDIVRAMLVANATFDDIADYLEIEVNTLKRRHGDLLRTAKRDICAKIGGQLANMAMGYRTLVDPDTGEITKVPVEEKTQVSAAQFYQERVGKWVTKTEHEVTGRDGGPILSATLSAMDEAQLSGLLAGLLASGQKPLEATVVSE